MTIIQIPFKLFKRKTNEYENNSEMIGMPRFAAFPDIENPMNRQEATSLPGYVRLQNF